jgi:hypothetical protein
MANRILIPNGGEAVEAEYNEQVIEEYGDNPFIEALPPILNELEAVEKLAVYPNFDPQERRLDKQYRIHMVQRLFLRTFHFKPAFMVLKVKIIYVNLF